MNTKRTSKTSLVYVAALVIASAGLARADEPDVDFTDQEIKKLKQIGKTPYPVFSKTAGQGVVKLQAGNRARWNDEALVYLGSFGGWSSGSSVNMRNGDVFVNVGPSAVKVGSVELEKGEYVAFGNRDFQKKTLAELEGKSPGPPIASVRAKPSVRRWNDATGRFSTEAEYIDMKNGMVSLRKTDGKVIQVELQKLSESDRRHIELLSASDTTGKNTVGSRSPLGTDRTEITRRYVIKANKLDRGQDGAITLRNPVAELRIGGVVTDLITPGDTFLELTGKGAKVADLAFAGPCNLTVGKDWTLLAAAEDITATDSRGKLWCSRKARLAGKEVFAFFPQEPKPSE